MTMMMHPEMIATLPIWLAGLLIATVAVAGAVLIELAVRRLVSLEVRTSHTTVASAMFNVVGTTYAVLLAFVAMLAWTGFDTARSVTSTEASLVLEVARLVDGLGGSEAAAMHADIVAYAQDVVGAEWPAQARGEPVGEDEPGLAKLRRAALRLRPGSVGEGAVHAQLLGQLAALDDARRARLLVGQAPIPLMVWFVLLAGGEHQRGVLLVPGGAEPAHAPRDVVAAGAVGRAGAAAGRDAQQPVPWRLQDLGRAVRARAGADGARRAGGNSRGTVAAGSRSMAGQAWSGRTAAGKAGLCPDPPKA